MRYMECSLNGALGKGTECLLIDHEAKEVFANWPWGKGVSLIETWSYRECSLLGMFDYLKIGLKKANAHWNFKSQEVQGVFLIETFGMGHWL